MASSLAQQTSAQRSFASNSANFLGIKDIADVEPPLQSAFSFANPFPRIDIEQALAKPITDKTPLVFPSLDTQASPPTTNELLNFCSDSTLQNNLLFQMMPPSSSTSSADFLSIQPQMINSCDSDGSFSSSNSMTNETPRLNLNNNNNSHGDKRRKELVRDEAYWERRRKNNDAAKRSRDSRRKKEDEVAVRAAILEQENLRLRFEVERLRIEIERHRIVALNSKMATQSPFPALQSTP